MLKDELSLVHGVPLTFFEILLAQHMHHIASFKVMVASKENLAPLKGTAKLEKEIS